MNPFWPPIEPPRASQATTPRDRILTQARCIGMPTAGEIINQVRVRVHCSSEKFSPDCLEPSGIVSVWEITLLISIQAVSLKATQATDWRAFQEGPEDVRFFNSPRVGPPVHLRLGWRMRFPRTGWQARAALCFRSFA